MTLINLCTLIVETSLPVSSLLHSDLLVFILKIMTRFSYNEFRLTYLYGNYSSTMTYHSKHFLLFLHLSFSLNFLVSLFAILFYSRIQKFPYSSSANVYDAKVSVSSSHFNYFDI